jgi:hypothetical protein
MSRNIFACVTVLVLSFSLVAQEKPPVTTPAVVEKPRVFVTDSQSWEISGSAAGSNGTFAAQSHGGARPQTAEIIKTFGQRCADVVVNNRQEFADYIVLLDHEGGKGYLRHRNKVAVFAHISGDAVVSHSTLSLGGSVEDACNGIIQHWSKHNGEILSAKEKALTPQTSAPVPVSVVAVPQPSTISQASVNVDSTPSGADIEIDGIFVGNTPSTINVAMGSHDVAVKRKGFVNWAKKLNVSGGSIHLNAELEADSAKP